jgi:hypothetical protein
MSINTLHKGDDDDDNDDNNNNNTVLYCTAVRSFNPEQWGSPLVQEKYQEE